MKLRFLVIGLAVALLASSMPTTSLARSYQPNNHTLENDYAPLKGWWSTHRAYECGVVFWTWRPHYGAFFSGLYGHSPTYYGSGNPGDISAWDWYPNPGDSNRLLIDGTFYWGHSSARDPDNWEATLYMN